MSDLVLALVLAAVVAAMIISQVKGVTLTGRRMLLLPAILPLGGPAGRPVFPDGL